MSDEYDGEMMTYGGDGPDIDMSDETDDSAEMLDDGDMVETDPIFE